MTSYSNNIGVLLAEICRAQRSLAESGLNEFGLHVGQDRLLLGLMHDDSVGQSDLVEHLCVEPATVTKMLQRMERAGFVERRPDELDGRASRVSLTDEGRALQEPILHMWNRLEEQMLANMTDVEQTLLRRLLMHALANLAALEAAHD